MGQKLFRLKDDRLDGSSRWEKDRPTRNGDIVIYMKAGEFFNMEAFIKATIVKRRDPSLDVLVNGERVTLATKWWWSRKIGRASCRERVFFDV